MLTTIIETGIRLGNFSDSLDSSQQIFLSKVGKKLNNKLVTSLNGGFPVYLRSEYSDQAPTLIKDFVINERNLLEEDVGYRYFIGGGCLVVQLSDCTVVVYDDKSRQLRPFRGIAKASEAFDLSKAAIRRGASEELFICDLDEQYRFVPPKNDIEELDIYDSMDCWHFRVKKGVSQIGTTKTSYRFDFENRVLETIVTWQIDMPASKVKVFHCRDRVSGALSGIVPKAIDTHFHGREIGHWSRYGFVKEPIKSLDPVLKEIINNKLVKS